MRKFISWTFYARDAKHKIVFSSEKVCKYPTRTKNYKEVQSLLQKVDEVKSAGCCITTEYKPYL